MNCLFLVLVRSLADMHLSFLSAKIHTACVQISSVNVWLIAGIPFLTVLISVPSQRLGVQLNKSIFLDFSDINFVLSSML